MSDTLEHWLPIVGYDFEYEVSDLGNVRRVDTGKIVPQHSTTKLHYKAVALCKNSKYVCIYVHRLVCAALEHSRNAQMKRMEDPAQRQRLREATLKLNENPEYRQRQAEGSVRRWQKPEEHAAQSARTTAYFSNPENRKKARDYKENIIKACQCIETGIIYASFMDAQRATGIPAANISRTCRAYANGKILHAGGFTWRYPTQTKASK